MFSRLNGIVEKVDAKFKRFSNIASSVTKDILRYATAITLTMINSSIANC